MAGTYERAVPSDSPSEKHIAAASGDSSENSGDQPVAQGDVVEASGSPDPKRQEAQKDLNAATAFVRVHCVIGAEAWSPEILDALEFGIVQVRAAQRELGIKYQEKPQPMTSEERVAGALAVLLDAAADAEVSDSPTEISPIIDSIQTAASVLMRKRKQP